MTIFNSYLFKDISYIADKFPRFFSYLTLFLQTELIILFKLLLLFLFPKFFIP